MSEQTKIDDGGPAFPQPETKNGNPIGSEWGRDASGMSLRDWFAGHAPNLGDVITSNTESGTRILAKRLGVQFPEGQLTEDDMLRLAVEMGVAWKFHWADAMLAKPNEGGAR